MRSIVFVIMICFVHPLTTHTHAERVACASTLTKVFSETHADSSEHTPAPFEEKKEAFLSIYHAATEGLTIEELQGLMRQPFDFKDFVEATNLARAGEKLKMLKEKVLPNFSIKEQDDVMTAIQTFLVDKVSNIQKSQKRWNEKRQKKIKDSNLVQTLVGHTAHVFSVIFSPDGKRLASGSIDGTVRIWDPHRPLASSTILNVTESLIASIAFSPDGKRLATGGGHGAIRILNLGNSSKKPIILKGCKGTVHSVAFSPDGRFLATGGENGTRLYDLKNPTALPTILKGHSGSVRSVAFSPDGKRLASGGNDGVVYIQSLRNPSDKPIVLKKHESWAYSVAFSPDGRHLASASMDITCLWNLENSVEPPIALKGYTNLMSLLAFSPDGTHLASGGDDRTIRIWNLRNPWLAPIVLEGSTGRAREVTFSPDGSIIASGSTDGIVRLWKWRKILGLDPLEEDAP